MRWAQLRTWAYGLAVCALVAAVSAVAFRAPHGEDSPTDRDASQQTVSPSGGKPESHRAGRDANPVALEREVEAPGTKGGFASDAIKKGDEAYRRKDWDSAISCFSEAIRLRPENAELYSKRATAYRWTGEFGKAIADLTEAIRLSPEDATMFYYRGIYYGMKNDFDQASSDFEAAIRLKPDYANEIMGRPVDVPRRPTEAGTKNTPVGGAGPKALSPSGGKPEPHQADLHVNTESLKKEAMAAGTKGERLRREHQKV